MPQLINFSNCPINVLSSYGGSDRKFGILYQGQPYMIKFAEKSHKLNELATSSINNCISEYLGSSIAASINIPTHETLLGYYAEELVVACKDFCGFEYLCQEFSQFMRMQYDSADIGKLPKLEQIYEVYNNNPILSNLKDGAIQRYWDTFIVDVLLANFDRHKGNWAFLVNKSSGEVSLAPTYDYGSTLYPAIGDDGVVNILNDDKEILKRIYVFPNAALLINNIKANYYDILTSGYDTNCSDAIKRIVPRIDMERINLIIDETPIVSKLRKNFYKIMLNARKKLLLDKSLQVVNAKQFNSEALDRLNNGKPYTEELFEQDYARGRFNDDITIIQELRYKFHTDNGVKHLDAFK